MEKLDYLIVFLVCSIPFVFYLANPNIIGSDPYLYLDAVCNDSPINERFNLFGLLLPFIPCSIILIKIILFLLYFGIVLTFSKIGELFDKRKGWLVGLILAGTTFFITEAWKFENDMFGYFFAFIAFYFILKYRFFSKSKFDLLLSLIFFVLGGLFWKGTIYWLAAASVFSLVFLPLSFLAVWFVNQDFFWFVNAPTEVLEQQPWIGIIYLGLPIFLIVGMLNTKKEINLAFILTLIPALFVSKLFVLPLLFVCLIAFEGAILIFNSVKGFSTTKLFEKLMKNNVFDYLMNIWFLKVDWRKLLYFGLIFFSIFMSFNWGSGALNQFPTQDDVDLVKLGIELSPVYIENDFSAGYLIKYYGGNPSCAGKLCEYKQEGYVIGLSLTDYEQCEKISESKHFQLIRCI